MSTSPRAENRTADLIADVQEALRGHGPLVNLLPDGKENVQIRNTTVDTDEMDAVILFDIVGGSSDPGRHEAVSYLLQTKLEWTFDWHGSNPDGQLWRYRVADEIQAVLEDLPGANRLPDGKQGGIDPQPDPDERRYIADQVWRFTASVGPSG